MSAHFLNYAAFRRFVRNCWWLELVKASTSDNKSDSPCAKLADMFGTLRQGAVGDKDGYDSMYTV
ncbi:MAG: hypothetical protein N2V75_02400 [Methanophagales archaeon]|nr:hypothetical protein [Methanophagales archaeon]